MAAGGAAGGAQAAAAAVTQAIKASGVLVAVDPKDFQTILDRQQEPLVVTAEGGFFSKTYKYLTSYKGLAFYAQSPDPIRLGSRCEVVKAKKIWTPG